MIPTKHPVAKIVQEVITEIEKEDVATPYEETLLVGDRDRLTLIFNSPGESTDPHWHLEFDEWWIVMAGTLQWTTTPAPTNVIMTGGKYSEEDVTDTYTLESGDIVYVPKHFKHSIKNIGDDISCRLAVATPEAPHIWEKKWVGATLTTFQGV